MKTEAHLKPTAIFLQRVITAVSELKVEIGSLPHTSAFLRITSRRISCSTSVESKAEKAETIDRISLMKNIGTSVKVFLANKLCGDANGRETSPSTQDVYEVCPRKNQDGFDLISDRLPYGPIWYAGPDAIRYAAAYEVPLVDAIAPGDNPRVKRIRCHGLHSQISGRFSRAVVKDLVQTEIARHGPMIRCVRVSDGRPRRRQALRKYEVKGGVRKAVSPWVSYSFR